MTFFGQRGDWARVLDGRTAHADDARRTRPTIMATDTATMPVA